MAFSPRSQALAPPGCTPASEMRSTRTFCLALNTANASGVKSGAISTSTNCFDTASAAAPSTGTLKAMMPPKALVGSVLKAF